MTSTPTLNATKVKVIDSLVRVSKMNGRTESAESTMTIDDQVAFNASAIGDRGGRLGKTLKALDQSGHTVADSPQWKEAMRRIREGESDGIAVAYGDRLMRNWFRLGAMLHELETYNAEVIISAMPNVDYRTTDGRTQMGMVAIMSDMQYGAAKARGDRTFARVKERGVLNAVPYGYKRNAAPGSGTKAQPERDAKALVPDPAEADAVRLIFDLKGKGWGYTAIADELHRRGVLPPGPKRRDGGDRPRGARWAHTSLRNIILNPVYLGHVVYGRTAQARARAEGRPVPELTTIKGCHDPIVTPTTWRKAQTGRTIIRNGKMTGGTATGLLYCETCGARMSAIGSGEHGRVTYGCRSHTSSREKCPQRVFIKRATMDEWLREQLRDLLTTGKLKAVVSARDLVRVAAEREAATEEVRAYVVHVPATTPGYAEGLAVRQANEQAKIAAHEDALAQAGSARGLPVTNDALDMLDGEAWNELARELVASVTVSLAASKRAADVLPAARCAITWRHGQ